MPERFPTPTSLILTLILIVGSTAAGRASDISSVDAIGRLDRITHYVKQLESRRWIDWNRLFGASRNLIAFADRWPTLRARLLDAAAGGAGLDTAAIHGPISTPSLQISRYAGFTQSQTSTAWCGSSVLTFFNDTASEAKTMAALSGVTAVGFATSSDQGKGFAYQGAPPGGINFDQTLIGSPTVACTSATQFFYSAIWLDTLNSVAGVALARSTEGGHSFSSPAVAVRKDASTHLIDHDWLAIDASHSTIYTVYADLDYSGLTCGADPDTGSPIPRYAIERVVSTNMGTTRSTPSIVEQICADATSPWAAVMGPQVAIAPSGDLYVTYEAAGQNGGAATSRQIKIARSTDSGVTFTPPVVVTVVSPVGDAADLQGLIRANEFPSIAIGKSAKDSGFIYLAWDDGGNAVPDSFSTTGSYAFSDIKMSASRDYGDTWKTPIRVNTNAKGGGALLTDQFEPAIAADTKGALAVCFYDRRRDANNFQIDRECAKSFDGGTT